MMKNKAALMPSLYTIPALLMVLLGTSIQAQTPDHIVGSLKTQVMPEQYLRAYDPITVFFATAKGPAKGGPLDQPQGVIELTPNHPGEYRWLDGRTLQFLPTIPWPALARFKVKLADAEHQLFTLMAPPSATVPAISSRNLDQIGEITLSFAQPIDPAQLAQMITLDIRPQPGTNAEAARSLTQRDFTITALERSGLDRSADYLLHLNQAIGFGNVVQLNFRLSQDVQAPDAQLSYRYATKPVFRIDAIGTAGTLFPVTAAGSSYSRDQALDGGSGEASINVRFSDAPAPLLLDQVKALVHFEPAVRDLKYELNGQDLKLSFTAVRETSYRISLANVEIKDRSGRKLAAFGPTECFVFFKHAPAFVRWMQARGIVERYGPQQFPMEARDTKHLDVRVHKIDPLNRNFWPFPAEAVVVDEEERPGGPGEEPEPRTRIDEQIRQLGTPLVSRIVNLGSTEGNGRRFGLDLKPLLADVSGKEQPGTYLIGYRELGSSKTRSYVRVQVTDLCLSVIEEQAGVVFVVTSLRSAQAVADAEIFVEGFDGDTTLPIIQGRTDQTGQFHYTFDSEAEQGVARIRVAKGSDALVLDPAEPAPSFVDNHFSYNEGDWLSWLNESPQTSKHESRYLGFIFSERPVYRPEEPVHLRGYIRSRHEGVLEPGIPDGAELSIFSGSRQWTAPVSLDAFGNYYYEFNEEDLPSGTYYVSLRTANNGECGNTSFLKEAYKIPRFEVNLDGADKVPLDRPFKLDLTATYYAGGRVADQDLTWRITTLPYTWQSEAWADYLFSTDERFSNGARDLDTNGSTRSARTDEHGSATLYLDPTSGRDAQPRKYVVEATIKGADEQTVSTTKSVLALPPFVLGLQLPRLLKGGESLKANILVLDFNGKPKVDQEVQIRVFQRQWHSYLVESDFTTGKAKYVTDVVDTPLLEELVTSIDGPLTREIPVKESGVYLVEILARDALGRIQKVKTDVFYAGDEPVSWQKPKEQVFEMLWDKASYNPGDTATLIIKSPFQQAEALVIVEAPDENHYSWVHVEGGKGLFSMKVSAELTPTIPIHVQLIRGRIKAEADARLDLGKPICKSSTSWLKVNPKAFQALVTLKHEASFMPGSEMPLEITLKDPDGVPLDGEVTVWLVDRAVLALGREGSLNALSVFLPNHEAYIRLRDTRNDIFGELPSEPFPGGDGSRAGEGLFGEVTVRKNFKTVPYYKAGIPVIAGKLQLSIPLPDNLTDFAIRAVASSGASRFGYARSTVAVRLPVIIQSALPRFVRPGDRFVAGGIGRVVQGSGGAGRAELKVEGLAVKGEKQMTLNLEPNKPQKVYFPLEVSTQAAAPGAGVNTVKLALAIKRESDGAKDAFEVNLPVRPDRDWETRERFDTPSKDKALSLLEPDEAARPNTLTREVYLTSQPALIKMLAALDYNQAYPHTCAEQRISSLLPQLALAELLKKVGRNTDKAALERAVKETLEYLKQVQRSSGLMGFWPGRDGGYVGLSAYALEFFVEAREKGYKVDDNLYNKTVSALQASLRSDYSGFIANQSYEERALALHALARANVFDRTYAFELAARSSMMSLAGKANILHTLLKRGLISGTEINDMSLDLHKSVTYGLNQGKEVYKGLQYRSRSFGGLVLSSESKTLASVTRALYRKEPDNAQVRLLVDELVSLGRGNGWGDTSSNTAALLALNECMTIAPRDAGQRYALTIGSEPFKFNTAENVIEVHSSHQAGPASLSYQNGDGKLPLVMTRMRYLPSAEGSSVGESSQGFALTRELERYDADGAAPQKIEITKGLDIDVKLGTIIEEHLRVVNPEDRVYVAISVPFAAGLEPLNPNLANAPKEAKTRGSLTLTPSYARYEDDQVTFYYDELPKGTYHFYFRTRATTEGSFTHPAARAEMMYHQSIFGRGAGSRIQIKAE